MTRVSYRKIWKKLNNFKKINNQIFCTSLKIYLKTEIFSLVPLSTLKFDNCGVSKVICISVIANTIESKSVGWLFQAKLHI